MLISEGYSSASRANRGKPPYERMMEKIIIDPISGCWLWQGCCDKDGYGFIRIEGKNVKVHRFSLEHHTGRKLKTGEQSCHDCDTPPCINPGHLYAGNNRRNQQDAARRGRSPGGKLSLADVQNIRMRRESGERPCDIAKDFAVHPSTVTCIANRHKWAHV